MQIALIADIHANAIALDIVLEDIAKAGVDQIICLGDVATFGPHPRAVLDRLIALDAQFILGNHDDFILDPARVPALSWVSDWYAQQLTPEHLDFIQSFKPRILLPISVQEELLCFHGSPNSYTDNILSTTAPDDVDAMLTPYRAAVMAGGHTHIQMMRQHRGTMLINPGSVGQPFEQMPFPQEDGPRFLPWAEYALLNDHGGSLNVNLRRLPIDTVALKRDIINSGMPSPDYWLRIWQLA